MALAVSQAVKIEASSGTSVTANNAITFTAGAMAVAAVSGFQGTATNYAASDSVNGAYTGRTARDGGNPAIRICDKNSLTGGLANLTASCGASTSGVVGLWHEVTGQLTPTAFDTENGATDTSTAPDTVNATNAQADSIFFAAMAGAQAANPITYTINASGSEGTWITKDATNSRELDGNTFPACGVVYHALANLGTLPTVTPAGGSMVKITLSTSEMAGANATVVCLDAAGAEWCDLTINIPTAARQIDDLAYPATSGRSIVVDASGLVDANMVKSGPTGSGTAQTAGDIFARIGAPAGASIAADVAAVKVDTAAVKVQTDKLAFTVANQVDANVLDWKSATAPAMTGDAFARLGAPAGASVSADVAAVKVDTAAVKVQTDKMTFTVANKMDSNVYTWNGTAVSAPATAGIPEVNVKNINNVSAAAVTTVKAVQGLTTADTVVTVSGNVNGNVAGSVASVTAGVSVANGGIASTSFAAGAIDAAAIAADAIGASEIAADAIGSSELAASAANEIADALLARNIAGGSSAGRTVTEALRRLRNRVAIAAGTATVYQEDDSSSSWTAAVTTAAGNPVSEVDPA